MNAATLGAEETEVHTRLLRFSLGIEEARAWWAQPASAPAATAFAEQWFGRRSEKQIGLVVTNLRARYDAFPEALAVLRAWPAMSVPTRRAICHWHTQLSDPLYRAFTGALLPELRASPRPTISRDAVARWVAERQPDRWNATTRLAWASKLLSAAHDAGLVATTRDPRPLVLPAVPDDALAYLLHLLRGVRFDGDVLANPYLASVGLDGATLDDRLRALPDLAFRRMGSLRDLEWRAPTLTAWARDAHLGAS